MILAELHEGLQAYLHFKNGWPALYATVGEMPMETAEVFVYCLTTDAAAQQGNNLLAVAQAAAQGLWADYQRGMLN